MKNVALFYKKLSPDKPFTKKPVHDGEYQLYDTRKEFIEKANIGGRLLKDIRDEVENPSYMFDERRDMQEELTEYEKQKAQKKRELDNLSSQFYNSMVWVLKSE